MPDPVFLFSVDLEDVLHDMDDGSRRKSRVVENTEAYLALLRRYGFRATFFVVGSVAEEHPELLRALAGEGHEIACHSNRHVTLDKQDPSIFRNDTEACLENFRKAGIDRCEGYRAPVFSLTGETDWAYDVLQSLGFRYSSSVYPAKSPLHGWPGFGTNAREMKPGLWEIPMTLSGLPALNTPFAGGVFFRSMPWTLVRFCFSRSFRKNEPVLGYFHPYDLDTEQEEFVHPGMEGRRFFNWLMYYGRNRTTKRLEKIFRSGVKVMTYSDYLRSHVATA